MSRKTKKLIWAAPLMAAFAVVGALALFMALAPDPARADHVDLPGIVTGVTATADGRDTINVKWKAPADGGAVAYYRIDRSMNGVAWMRLEQMHTGSTSYTDTMGLKPGMPYHYRVFAVNSAGSGPSSDLGADNMATTAMAGAPGPVRMLTAAAMGPNQVNLSWYPPTDNGGASVVRYCIATWPDGATIPAEATLPTAATPTENDPAATDGTDCQATTTPTTLPAENAADAEGVIVVRAPTGAGKVEFMHKSLPHNHARHYQVYAVNSMGWSTVPSQPNPQPRTAQAGQPSAPILRITRDTVVSQTPSTDFWLTWPEDDGGAPISGWDVDTKIGDGNFADTGGFHNLGIDGLDNPTGAGPQCDSCTVQPDAITIVRVRFQSTTAQGDEGNVKEGKWSNTQTITTVGGATQGPPPPPAVAELEATTGKHLRQIDLSWKKEPGVGYVIDYREAGAPVDTGTAEQSVNEFRWMPLQKNTGYSEGTYRHHGLKPGTEYEYRVFPIKSGRYAAPAAITGMTKAATVPGVVTALRTSSDDPTMITVAWDKPAVEGGHPITGYRVEIGSDASWPADTSTVMATHPDDDCPALGAGVVCVRDIMGADNTMFTLGKLTAGTDRWFRVFAINQVVKDDGLSLTQQSLARPKKGTSAKAGTPAVPVDLTAQAARDANINEAARLGVDILWNAPDDPAGDVVTGYVIERRTKANAAADWTAWDTDWKMIDTGTPPRTSIGDTTPVSGLAAGEMRQYRVKAKSGEGTGPMTYPVTYPATNMAIPSVPQMVMAAKSADMPTSKVKVSWEAPAMNADDVTGYIIERKYPGDGVGAIPADGYNDGVMGRDHAFKNYKEWWETLNCKGMLRVAGSDAHPDVASEAKAMYCKHFLDTYPTKIADTAANADKAISEATAMEVKALFAKRYVTKSDDMGMTMTMFDDMMHYDMNLRANTEYTYRVRAIHGMKAGAWSAEVMVTTGNNAPMTVGTIDAVTVAAGATTAAMDVSGYFSDADNDALTYAAASDDDAIATANIPAGSNMLTISGVAAGSATITVTASDGNGGTAEQEIGVTVESADMTLGAPTGVTVEVDDEDPDDIDVMVTWENGANALSHLVLLFDTSDWSLAKPAATQQDSGDTTFRNVAPGTYVAVVVAYDATGSIRLALSSPTTLGGG